MKLTEKTVRRLVGKKVVAVLYSADRPYNPDAVVGEVIQYEDGFSGYGFDCFDVCDSHMNDSRSPNFDPTTKEGIEIINKSLRLYPIGSMRLIDGKPIDDRRFVHGTVVELPEGGRSAGKIYTF